MKYGFKVTTFVMIGFDYASPQSEKTKQMTLVVIGTVWCCSHIKMSLLQLLYMI
jgi:hypothetical protein